MFTNFQCFPISSVSAYPSIFQRAVSDAQEAVAKLCAQRREVEVRLETGSGDSVGQMKTLRLLLEQLDYGIQNARTVADLAVTAAKDKAEALVAASQEREALERVVMPRREQAEALRRVAEQKSEDEAALTRFRREGRSTA